MLVFCFNVEPRLKLHALRSICRSLTPEVTRASDQAFVSCRLDYCNSLLAGVAEVHFRRIQSAQDVAARLVCGARLYDHITSVLATEASLASSSPAGYYHTIR